MNDPQTEVLRSIQIDTKYAPNLFGSGANELRRRVAGRAAVSVEISTRA